MARLKSNLVDDIIEKIIQRINAYEYVSGDPISEVALAAEFEISRTPIREAVMRLIDIGLLEREQTKVVVKSLKLDDIKEILDARLALELMSIYIVMQRGGFIEEELAKLESFQKAFEDNLVVSNFEGNFDYDVKFHTYIIQCSQNTRLMEFARRLDIQSQRFKTLTMLTPYRHSEAREEHDAIIKAIQKNEEQAIIEALKEHTYNSKNNYDKILNNDTWLKMMQNLKN